MWAKLVDADQPAPTDPAALSFLTMTTKPSFRAEFKAGEWGKTLVSMARWVSTRGEGGAVVGNHDGDGCGVGQIQSRMSFTIAILIACILSGLAALVGIGVQAIRHGVRGSWSWLMLPIGALLSFSLVSAAIGFAEGVWLWSDWRLWAFGGFGLVGLLGQVLGWKCVLRPRLRASQCPACEYEVGAMPRCPECGRSREPSDG